MKEANLAHFNASKCFRLSQFVFRPLLQLDLVPICFTAECIVQLQAFPSSLACWTSPDPLHLDSLPDVCNLRLLCGIQYGQVSSRLGQLCHGDNVCLGMIFPTGKEGKLPQGIYWFNVDGYEFHKSRHCDLVTRQQYFVLSCTILVQEEKLSNKSEGGAEGRN